MSDRMSRRSCERRSYVRSPSRGVSHRYHGAHAPPTRSSHRSRSRRRDGAYRSRHRHRSRSYDDFRTTRSARNRPLGRSPSRSYGDDRPRRSNSSGRQSRPRSRSYGGDSRHGRYYDRSRSRDRHRDYSPRIYESNRRERREVGRMSNGMISIREDNRVHNIDARDAGRFDNDVGRHDRDLSRYRQGSPERHRHSRNFSPARSSDRNWSRRPSEAFRAEVYSRSVNDEMPLTEPATRPAVAQGAGIDPVVPEEHAGQGELDRIVEATENVQERIRTANVKLERAEAELEQKRERLKAIRGQIPVLNGRIRRAETQLERERLRDYTASRHPGT
ncbi:hypothetical protein FB567DRAFT_523063 [Paraphoma chrysanthemicola]|uniref:Uncharacterized protein n=1 Tax=Paraphoma chrysanthemicola TaxID=798071 RepID=A0A8K0W053_9PLEO|nr:hypothetical protein FB567DRAFT_523063 [Paraphoma chrysanthemicola]